MGFRKSEWKKKHLRKWMRIVDPTPLKEDLPQIEVAAKKLASHGGYHSQEYHDWDMKRQRRQALRHDDKKEVKEQLADDY